MLEPIRNVIVVDKFLRLKSILIEMILPEQKMCRVEIKLSGTGGKNPLKVPSTFSAKGEWRVASNQDQPGTAQLQKQFEEIIPNVRFGLVADWKLVTEIRLDQGRDFFTNAVTIAMFVCDLLGVELKKDVIKWKDKVVTWLNTWYEIRKTEYYYHGKWYTSVEDLRDAQIMEMIEAVKNR